MNTNQFTFDPNRALPAVAYRDEQWLAAEMERIWYSDWVFVTTEDSLSVPGDQLPVLVGEKPVLLLRQQTGELAALSNLCAHRGTLLVDQPCNSERIQCPYHAWTYDDSGRLLAVPYGPKDGFDRVAHHLPTYRVATWHGLVFVSLNSHVESLSTRFAVIQSHVCARGIDAFEHQSNLQSTEVWHCNWKVAISNAMESYHLFKVHPQTLEPYSPTRDAYYITGSAYATVTGGAIRGHDDYLLISLPPAFVGVIGRGSFTWLSVHPVGTGGSAMRFGAAYANSEGSGSFRRLGEWLWKMVGYQSFGLPDFLPEDKEICERIQRGFTGDFSPGQLLPVERVVADFGHYLNWRLNQVEPPQAHLEARS